MSHQSSVCGIARIHKIKCSNGGGLSKRIEHNLREFVSDNVDTSRLELDEFIGATTRQEIISQIHQRWNTATTRRKDNVGVLEVLVTTTGKLPKGTEKDFIEQSLQQLKGLYGEENFIGAYIHRDEKETHIHSFIVPLEEKKVEKNRLSTEEQNLLKQELDKRRIEFLTPPKKPSKDCTDEKLWAVYKKNKKNYEKFKTRIKPILEELGISKTERVLSCQKYCDGKESLSQFQDLWYNSVFKKFGLARGEIGNKRRKWQPAELKKWQENLERKEQELDQREQDGAQLMIDTYQSRKKELLKQGKLSEFNLPEPTRKESAKDYRARILPEVEAVKASGEIFHDEFWKLRRANNEELSEVKNNLSKEIVALQQKNEALQVENSRLTQAEKELANMKKAWQELTPNDLRDIADRREQEQALRATRRAQNGREGGRSY